MGDAASDPGKRGDFALRHPVGWANAAASASQSGRSWGSPATSTDLASGSDGAEHHTIRLLHPGERRAETRCIARQDLNRRAALALQRGRDPPGQGRVGVVADDLEVALAHLTAAQLDLQDPVCGGTLVRVLVSLAGHRGPARQPAAQASRSGDCVQTLQLVGAVVDAHLVARRPCDGVPELAAGLVERGIVPVDAAHVDPRADDVAEAHPGVGEPALDESISNLENGIWPTLSANGLVRKNVAYGSEDSALWVEASENVRVLNNEFHHSPTGLEITVSKNVVAKKNHIHHNTTGIGLYHPSAASLPPLGDDGYW